MFAKAVKDAFVIAGSDERLATRMRLLGGLVSAASGRGRVLGFRVANTGRQGLHLLYSEIFARDEYRFTSPRPDPVILDCGANIGMATLYFKWRYPRARIAAFEPDPSAFALLEANIAGNALSDVTAHNVALAGTESTLSLHSPNEASVLASVVPGRADAPNVIDVPAKRLSAFVDGPVDLLKLDVEGMEGPVLRELASSGALANVGEAIIEVHHNLPHAPSNLGDVSGLLGEAGFVYEVVGFYSPGVGPDAYQDVVLRARRPRPTG